MTAAAAARTPFELLLLPLLHRFEGYFKAGTTRMPRRPCADTTCDAPRGTGYERIHIALSHGSNGGTPPTAAAAVRLKNQLLFLLPIVVMIIRQNVTKRHSSCRRIGGGGGAAPEHISYSREFTRSPSSSPRPISSSSRCIMSTDLLPTRLLWSTAPAQAL